MVVVPVCHRGAQAVFGRLDLIGNDSDDAALVASVTPGGVDTSLYADDAADLTHEQLAGIGSRTAVRHLEPAGIEQFGLVVGGVGSPDILQANLRASSSGNARSDNFLSRRT